MASLFGLGRSKSVKKTRDPPSHPSSPQSSFEGITSPLTTPLHTTPNGHHHHHHHNGNTTTNNNTTTFPSRRSSITRKLIKATTLPSQNHHRMSMSSDAIMDAHNRETIARLTAEKQILESRLTAERDAAVAVEVQKREAAEEKLRAEKQEVLDKYDTLNRAHLELRTKSNRYKLQYLALLRQPLREPEGTATTAFTALFRSIRQTLATITPPTAPLSIPHASWTTLLTLLSPPTSVRDTLLPHPSLAAPFLAAFLVHYVLPSSPPRTDRQLFKDLWTHEATADSLAELEDDLRPGLSVGEFNTWRTTTIRHLQSAHSCRTDSTRLRALSASAARVISGLYGRAEDDAEIRTHMRTLITDAVAVSKSLRRLKAEFIAVLPASRVLPPRPGVLLGKGSWRGRRGAGAGAGEPEERVEVVLRPELVRASDEEGMGSTEDVVIVEAEWGEVRAGVEVGLARRQTIRCVMTGAAMPPPGGLGALGDVAEMAKEMAKRRETF